MAVSPSCFATELSQSGWVYAVGISFFWYVKEAPFLSLITLSINGHNLIFTSYFFEGPERNENVCRDYILQFPGYYITLSGLTLELSKLFHWRISFQTCNWMVTLYSCLSLTFPQTFWKRNRIPCNLCVCWEGNLIVSRRLIHVIIPPRWLIHRAFVWALNLSAAPEGWIRQSTSLSFMLIWASV